MVCLLHFPSCMKFICKIKQPDCKATNPCRESQRLVAHWRVHLLGFKFKIFLFCRTAEGYIHIPGWPQEQCCRRGRELSCWWSSTTVNTWEWFCSLCWLQSLQLSFLLLFIYYPSNYCPVRSLIQVLMDAEEGFPLCWGLGLSVLLLRNAY